MAYVLFIQNKRKRSSYGVIVFFRHIDAVIYTARKWIGGLFICVGGGVSS